MPQQPRLDAALALDVVGTGVVAEAAPSELSAEDRQLLADPVAAGAWDLVSRRYAARRPTLDFRLALELGIDSNLKTNRGE